MESLVIERLSDSISIRVAALGACITVVGYLLDPLAGLGIWAGITGLVGLYVVLLSSIAFCVLEFLRVSGY